MPSNSATSPTPKGTHTRQTILDTAVQLASQQGLECLTIGRLARRLAMSKSGLFAHFGSKESLQLSTIEAAGEIFRNEVIRPVMGHKKGLPRLWAVCDNFLLYEENKVFSGGCFFAMVTAEYKNRPGLIRDALTLKMEDWLSFLATLIGNAKALGDLNGAVSPAAFALELQSLFIGANWAYQVLGRKDALNAIRNTIHQRLKSSATPQGLKKLPGLHAPTSV